MIRKMIRGKSQITINLIKWKMFKKKRRIKIKKKMNRNKMRKMIQKTTQLKKIQLKTNLIPKRTRLILRKAKMPRI